MKSVLRHNEVGMRLTALFLAVAFLASSGLAEVHAHPDGSSAADDCVACVVGVSTLLDAPEPSADATPGAETLDAGHFDPQPHPSTPFARPCGLRDPPIRSA